MENNPSAKILPSLNFEIMLNLTQSVLGIEGGATRTVALLATPHGSLIQRLETGPSNLRLASDHELHSRFAEIAATFPSPSAIGIGLAGARTASDRQRILQAAQSAWPGISITVTHDLDTALLAAPTLPPLNQVLVLSGTGSCCFGKTSGGKTVQIGGWGHILGDKGSGYEIGLRALKAVVYYYDRDGRWPPLGSQILRALQLNEPNDLLPWIQQASKNEVAQLAISVFDAWHRRDKIAQDILTAAAHSLAKDAVQCARRLKPRSNQFQFILSGSVLLRQPKFARLVRTQIHQSFPKAPVLPLTRESAWGAVVLAQQSLPASTTPLSTQSDTAQTQKIVSSSPQPSIPLPISTRLSPTEERNPNSLQLDQINLNDAIELMLSEEHRVPRALLSQRRRIARAIGLIVQTLRSNGRIFYVGAGTSGRLGVLDASECPPTFRTDPDQFQGVIAGGRDALWRSIEGAEDDAAAGMRALQFRRVTARDLVIGIAASGRTPFVWGAFQAAQNAGAKFILVCFNPHLKIPPSLKPALVIDPVVGPEVLTGSTRLKAGTATKLILNLFSTLAMVRTGKVVSNLMVDLNPSNAKLRQRAIRIVQQITNCPPAQAECALQKAQWNVKAACRSLSRNQPPG